MAESAFQQMLETREMIPRWMGVPGVVEYFFTKNFYDNQNPRESDSDSFQMVAIDALQTPGPGNVRNGRAKIVSGQGATPRYGTGFRYFVERPFEMDAVLALQEIDSRAMQNKGEQILDLAIAEEEIRWRLFKEIVIAHIMHTGRVNMAADGNLLVPTVNATTGAITDHASAALSCDFGVADSHRGNLGGIISALWSVQNTKIANQLESLRRQAGIAGVPKPTKIKINALNKKYLRANDEFVEWAAAGTGRNAQAAADAVLQGDFIKGLWGWDWEFVDGTWTDSGGTTRDLIPLDRAVITPPDGPWLRAAKICELVPTNVGLTTDMRSAANSFGKVYGPFAYAKVDHNPPRLSGFFGDRFGLNFAAPNAVWMPSCFPSS